MYDVIIVGAGVTGCAVARYLSRCQGSFLVLEREEDVCCGTSKANSAIVHAGFDAAHGSLMAKFNLRGSELMEPLSRELDFPYRRSGSLVVCMAESDRPRLNALYENGVKNGVPGLEIVERDRLRELEPNISPDAVAALWAPTGAIVCPFGLTIALAENAAANGVRFQFNTKVTAIRPENGHWVIETNCGTFETRAVVNAAGVYADVLHNQVSARKLHITPRRGDYCLLDKTTGSFARHTVFQLPGKYGKGVLVSPTVHGNTIVGPTAIDIEDKDGTNTTAAGLDELIAKAGTTMQNLPIRQVITSFAGLRAHEDGHEFILGECPDAPGFFDCAASAPHRPSVSIPQTSCKRSFRLQKMPALSEHAPESSTQRRSPARTTTPSSRATRSTAASSAAASRSRKGRSSTQSIASPAHAASTASSAVPARAWAAVRRASVHRG